jgi:hypothetical protein
MFALGTVEEERTGLLCFGEAEFFVGFKQQERNLGYTPSVQKKRVILVSQKVNSF